MPRQSNIVAARSAGPTGFSAGFSPRSFVAPTTSPPWIPPPLNRMQFDGPQWSPLGTSVSDVVEALVSTEEGLYVGGTFDRAGVGASVGLGLWHYED